MDDIRFDPIGFRSLIEGQATSSATLVSIGQRPIVPVKHEKIIVIMLITGLMINTFSFILRGDKCHIYCRY